MKVSRIPRRVVARAVLAALALRCAACGGGADAPAPGASLAWRVDLERGEVLSVAFAPDGAHLVSTASNDRVRVHDARTGEVVEESRAHRRGVRAAAFDPAGRRVASGGPDRTVRVWTASPLAEERVLEAGERPPIAVGWSADGARVLTVTMAGALRAWDAADGALLLDRPGPAQRGVMAVALSADGARCAWAADGGNLRVWSTSDGARLGEGRIQGLGFVAVLDLAPDGRALVVGLRDDPVLVAHDLDQGTSRTFATLDAAPRALAFDPSGTRLACATRDGTVLLLDARSGRELARPCGPSAEAGPAAELAPHGLAFDPAGEHLVAAGPGPLVLSWDVAGVRALARGAPLAGTAPPRVLPELPVQEGVLDLARLAVPGYDPPELRDPAGVPLDLERFPPAAREHDGREVAVVGYPIVAQLEGGETRSFLLSRYPPGCCFGSVPVLDEWIAVTVPDGVPPLPPDVAVRVEGTLEIGELVDERGFAESLYRLRATAVR